MAYPAIALKNARNAFDARKDEYRKLSRNKKAALYSEIPELKALNSDVASLIRAAVSVAGGEGECAGGAAKTGISELIDKRNIILRAKNLPENYIDDVYFCQNCKDSGFDEKGVICGCYSEIIKREAYSLSNIGERIKNENFDTFDFSIFQNKKEIMINYEIVKGFCDNTLPQNNILFTGNTGTGKSFFSSCVAKSFLDSGQSVLYLSATQISNILDDAKFKRKPDGALNLDEYVDFIKDCDLLIIDDLGTEHAFPYSQSQLFDILETRYINRKKNVISTNLDLGELAQRYSQRFSSRALGYYEILLFQGADLRYGVKK
jgi:DNA replication protein DnaC